MQSKWFTTQDKASMGMISGNGEKAQTRRNKTNSNGEVKSRQFDLGLGQSLNGVQTRRVLEPRILLDAAAAETATTMIDSVAAEQAEHFFDSKVLSDSNIISVSVDENPIDGPVHEPTKQPSSITFIDANVADIETLIASIDPNSEIVILSSESDGVEQIAAHLDGRSNIDAIHIISHGRSGTLDLGDAKLTAISMTGEHADEMAVIRASLSDDADILIYGCDFAAGSRGANAVSMLAEVTSADIAASNDLTGAAILGGDWDLEVKNGEISAVAIAPSNWASTLDLTITDVGVGGVGVSGAAVDALAQQILGDGVTINSALYFGGAAQAGTFVTGAGASFGTNILTFPDGAIFSSGTAVSVAGPNNQGAFTENAPGIDNDPDFNALAGGNTFDASFIEITFTPDVPPGASVGDTARMTMEIVFGSDEYNEFVYGSVNDTLAVIVNGVNAAVVPNGLAIGIDTINDAGTFNPAFGSPTLNPNPEHTAAGFESANPSLYVNNETLAFNTQMDGFTITIPVTFDVIVGQPNTIKIGIADTADAAYDSWLFVKADSGQTVIVAENDSVTTPTNIPSVINVTANDYDLQGDTLTVTHILGQPVNSGDVITLASGATVTVGVGGLLTVSGDGVNPANDAFTYAISDGNGGTSTAFVNVEITAATNPPIAQNDTIAAVEDIPTSGNVLADNGNGVDSDPDSDPISVEEINGIAFTSGDTITLPSGALLTMNANGTFSYNPNGQFETLGVGDTGTDIFTYTINDGNNAFDTATVTINIAGQNDAPIAQNDAATVQENGPPINGDLTSDNGNGIDSDADGDALIVSTVNGLAANVGSQITLPSGALLTVNSNGTYDYDPNGAFESLGVGDTGSDSFTYTISDGNGGTSTAIVSLSIIGSNDAPVLDLDGDDSEAAGVDYEATYTENDPGISIVDTDFVLADPDGDISELVITLTNGQIGDTLQFPSSMPGGITASVLPVATLTSPGAMTLTLTGTGATTTADWNAVLAAITFLPSTNDVHNPDPSDRLITVEASDSQSVSSGLATATIHVIPQNDPPTLDLDDDNSGGVNAGNYLGTFVEDGGPVPIHSEIIISDLDDSDLTSATVSLTNPMADDQIIIDGVLVYDNGAIVSATGSSSGVSYSLALVSGNPVVTFTGVASITDYTNALESVSFNNTSQEPDTTNRVFQVTVNDGEDNSATRIATISVTEVNDPPAIQDPLNPGIEAPTFVLPALSSDDGVTVTGLAAVDLGQYFFDPDPSDVLTYTVSGLPTGLTFNPATGEVSGTIDPSASQGGPLSDGVYAIQIDVFDGDDTTTVSFDWTVSNPAPIAADDGFATDEDTVLTDNLIANINPLGASGNDNDPDGDILNVTMINGAAFTAGTQFALPSGALLTVNSNGSFDYDPNGQFNSISASSAGSDTFTYTIDDGEGGTDTATVNLTINGVNDAPTVSTPVADQTALDDQTVSIIPDFNDVDGGPLAYSVTGLPVGLSINPVTGEISGTIDNSASQGGPLNDGAYTITITADDGLDGLVDDVFVLTVTNPVPLVDAPVADQSFDDNQTVSVTPSISDPDSDTLSYSATGLPLGLVINPLTGEISGTIDNSASQGGPLTDGVYTVTITADDGEGGTVDDEIVFTISNPAPVIDTPVADQNFDDNQTVSVTPSISDPDSDTLSYSATGLPLGLAINPVTGEISGTIDNSASQGGPLSDGVYSVTITADDGEGGTIDDVVSFTISNPAPTALNDDVTIDEDSILSGDVHVDNGNGADIDPDGDDFDVTLVGGNSAGVNTPVAGNNGGMFTINTDGTFSFDPGTDFQDLDDTEIRVTTITYTINDGEGGTSQAVLSVTVTGANDAPVVIDPNDPFPDPNDPPVPTDSNNVIPDQTGSDGTPLAPLDISPYFVDVDGEPLAFGFDPLDPDVPVWLSINPITGEITGTPPTDASQGGPLNDGAYPITVTATDPDGEVVTTTVDFTISNIPPIAVNDTSSGTEDVAQSGNVLTDPLTGDADAAPDNDPVLVTDVNGTSVSAGSPAILALTYGELTLNEDGSWNFAPNSLANQLSDTDPDAVEIVTYTIDDGNGDTDTATLTINIVGINDPVQVVDPNDPETDPQDPQYDPLNPTVILDPDNLIADVVATDGETPSDIPAGDYFGDAEGDTLTFTATDLPDGLTIDLLTGLISGTVGPDASQNGNGATPGIYEVVITATDPQNNIATTTITYTVTNIPPDAQDDAVTHGEDGISTGDLFADNGNGVDQDTPPDTDPILVSAVDGIVGNVGIATLGTNGGMFTINDDGTYSFDPGTDFQDLDTTETRDTSITYQISDGNGGFDIATVTVTVEGANDAPVVIDPNDPFPDPNDPPVPTDPDNVIPDQTGNDGEPLSSLNITPYFVDVDGEPLTFGFDPLDPDVPSWLSINLVTGEITGTPPSDASIGGPNSDGVYPITVTATDPDGEVVTTTIDFTITNLAPDAQDDELDVPEDGITSGDVFADNGNGIDQDAPPDTDPIIVSSVGGNPAGVGAPVAGSNGGAFTINDDGTFDFDPGTDFQDLDDGDTRLTTIEYEISDGQGGFDTATLTITVQGQNDAPVIINPDDPFPDPNDPPVPGDPKNVIPDVNGSDASPIVPLDVTPYFYDVEGDPIEFSLNPGTTPSWMSIDPTTGIITGTPPSDASIGGLNSDGIYQITIIGTDDDGEQVSTTVDFTIVNPPPVTSGLPDDMEVAGNNYELETAGSFVDPDGDDLIFSAIGLPNGLTIDPQTGLISGHVDPAAVGAAPNGDGIYTVEVMVDDGQGGTVSTEFTLTISDPFSPPADSPELPLTPQGPDGPPQGGEHPDMIVDKAVNAFGTLGSDIGIFDFDHPVTQALYQISPLSEGISLDENGHPVTEAVSWIEKTRLALSEKTSSDVSYWAGGDIRTSDGVSEVIVRTLLWDGVIFLETLSGQLGTEWEVESFDGSSKPKWLEVYGSNLLAIPTNSAAPNSEIILMGADPNGDEIRIEVKLDKLNGNVTTLRPLGVLQAQGFDSQIQALVNKSIHEAQSLLRRST